MKKIICMLFVLFSAISIISAEKVSQQAQVISWVHQNMEHFQITDNSTVVTFIGDAQRISGISFSVKMKPARMVESTRIQKKFMISRSVDIVNLNFDATSGQYVMHTNLANGEVNSSTGTVRINKFADGRLEFIFTGNDGNFNSSCTLKFNP